MTKILCPNLSKTKEKKSYNKRKRSIKIVKNSEMN